MGWRANPLSYVWCMEKERKKEHIGYIIQLSQVVRLDFFFLFFFNQEMCPFKQYAHTHAHTHTRTQNKTF